MTQANKMSESNSKQRYSLSKEFMNDYELFVAEFDKIAEDLFKGEQLERLSNNFLNKHAEYIRCGPFTVETKFPNCSNNETLDEDLRIITGNSNNNNVDSNGEKEVEEEDEEETAAYAKVLADVYRRACQGCYLRVTYNKSRLNQEDDRREAVQFGRQALRYDPKSFLVCYWYMIALGWQLDVMTNAKERTFVARIFRESALRCTRLNPADPLPHNLLGRYYYTVASLNWLERTVAKQLLGCKLEGTYKDSEREFKIAHELKNDWLPTGLWLARVTLAQGRPMEEVERWINFGLKLDCKEPSSEIERKELLELRSKLKLCKN